MTDDNLIMTLAILGGTGSEGSGLAVRWAASGYRVIIGSRSAERAQAKADELNATFDAGNICGMGNVEAAARADLVVLTVPYAAHQETLEVVREGLQGKILVDVTVPLKPPKIRTVQLPDGQSAALEAQAFLGDTVRVVAAFQNISAEHLLNFDHPIECDVLVCGDSKEAKAEVLRLVEAAGMRGLDAGLLQNAIAVESLTPILLGLNSRYKGRGAGIRITGLDL